MQKTMVVAVGLTLILSATGWAGVNVSAKAAVHVIPHTSRSCTKSFPMIDGCEDITVTEPTSDVDAFPVFYDLVEYQGFDYAMVWPGLYSCVFTSCSDLSIGGIVDSGDGVSHAWTVCQYSSVAITGWAWIYDNGMVCIEPHPGTGLILIGDCQSGSNEPICPHCAAIGGYIGDDPCEPCDPTATAERTWGDIKAAYKYK